MVDEDFKKLVKTFRYWVMSEVLNSGRNAKQWKSTNPEIQGVIQGMGNIHSFTKDKCKTGLLHTLTTQQKQERPEHKQKKLRLSTTVRRRQRKKVKVNTGYKH